MRKDHNLDLPKFSNLISSLLPNPTEIEKYFDKLWPICRSITGNGVRQTLSVIQEICPLEVIETPSQTKVLDWNVPKEWNIQDAFIENENGERIVDFKKNNLHVLGYSTPIDQWFSLEELRPHLHSLPDQPNAIPYLTSYYQERWGFCLTHVQLQSFKPGKYRAVIRSKLENGSLSLGHVVLPSTEKRETKEVLLSTYVCHPSLANNELSGPLTSMFLYRALSKLKYRRYHYRFVFASETIGAITYLSKFGEHLKKHCAAGLVLTCCGDKNNITYKASRRGNAEIDKIAQNVLKYHGKPYQWIDFVPTGSDERQYCSPGYNLPVGSLMRTMYGEYPEYHTSLDDKSFVSFDAMVETIELYLKVILSFENNRFYQSNAPYGEPMLSPRGLYPTLGTKNKVEKMPIAEIQWILNYADGEHDLCSVSEKANRSILDLAEIAQYLEKKDLLTVV